MSNSAPSTSRLIPAALLGFGLLLLGGGLAFTAAASLAIRNVGAIDALSNARPVPDMEAALQRQRRAAEILPTSDILSDLARLEMASARLQQGSWSTAEAALKASLAGRPVDGISWSRLAYVLDQQGKTQEAASALAQSIHTSAFIPGFMQWRFSLAMKLWPALNDEQQALVAEQAYLLWNKKRNEFVRLSRMAVFSSQIEAIMQRYYPDEFESFLQRRRPLRHNP